MFKNTNTAGNCSPDSCKLILYLTESQIEKLAFAIGVAENEGQWLNKRWKLDRDEVFLNKVLVETDY